MTVLYLLTFSLGITNAKGTTRKIATAWGPIFINPFAEPGAKDGFSRRDGRMRSDMERLHTAGSGRQRAHHHGQ